MTAPGKLVIISGPSGSGKSTVVERLLELEPKLVMSVSATTRPPRDGEMEGRHYWFLSPEEFARRREAGEFLETVEVYPDQWYGTLNTAVDASREAGIWVVLEIDVEGRRSVVEQERSAVTIFIRPPSLEVLERQLRQRRTESEEAIARRLEVARRELEEAEEYQYQVTNHEVDGTARRIRQILQEEGLQAT